MKTYSAYFELLGSAFDSVIGAAGWTLAGVLFAWLCGLWILALLNTRHVGSSAPESFPQWPMLHPAILASGWATQITVSEASLYLTSGFMLGNLVLVLLAIGGCMAWWRFKPGMRFREHVAFAAVGFATLLMGLWHHVASGLAVAGPVEFLVFSDLHRDLTIHVNLAGLIKDAGLPMVNQRATTTDRFNALTHTGHAVSIASQSHLMGISLYEASTVTWIMSTMLTGWAALALLQRSGQGHTVFTLLAVLATLVLGQFTFPWMHDPASRTSAQVTGIWVAARSFWNISQALSIALTMAGLLILDWYCDFRRRNQDAKWLLAVAVAVIATAGLVKPSIVIFYGPALLIWLVLCRARLVEYLVVLIVLQAGVFIHFLPRILHSLPSMPGWSLAFDPEQWIEVMRFLWHSFLSLALIVSVTIARSIANGWRDRSWQILDLGLIALAGSVLFALIFREDRFIRFIVMQPNIWWGVCACILLVVPLVGREVIGLLAHGRWTRWMVFFGLAVGAVQVWNGLHVTAVYPLLHQRQMKASASIALESARRTSTPTTRFALDPSLDNLDLRPYLSRPSLLGTGYARAADRRAYLQWRRFVVSGKGVPPLERLDAVVVHKNRTSANRYLSSRGWRAQALDADYLLWRRAPAR